MSSQEGFHAHQRGMRAVGLNMERTALEMREIQQSFDVFGRTDLSFGALSLIGEPARLRYTNALEDFRERLARGTVSAEGITRGLGKSADGYAEVENAALRDALAVLGDMSYAESAQRRPGDPSLPGDGLYLNSAYDSSPLGGFSDPHLMGLVGEGVVFGIGSWFLKDMHMWAEERARPLGYGVPLPEERAELARLAKTSRQTEALLKGAARMSAAAFTGAALWASAVVPSDEALDTALRNWVRTVNSLGGMFGVTDPVKREKLAEAWSGDAMDAADRKMRDFVTAAVQTTDQAIAMSWGLHHAVRRLNQLHDLAFKLVLGELVALAALHAVAAFFPNARFSKELIGWQISRIVLLLHGLIAAACAVMMTAEATGAGSATEGVPRTDFPIVNV
ncbi:hypothetical protein ACWDR1_32010 [Streptosporangium sandarakinum]|uniref:hypothetical protein n=1 Tax=Streptosporangium sandarakinum TaxID=1260955 RepID=UPI0033B3289E